MESKKLGIKIKRKKVGKQKQKVKKINKNLKKRNETKHYEHKKEGKGGVEEYYRKKY